MTFLGLFGNKKKKEKEDKDGKKSVSSPDNKRKTTRTGKDYLFLPKTDFPMKANLSQKEPEILAYWNEYQLYERIRIRAKTLKLPKFILHYGPPYANGAIHVGHALTECLKDILIKTYQMAGYDAPLVPGWDCHGLPIEWKIEEGYRKEKKNKEDVPIVEFLSQCRAFANNWVGVQKQGFQRLGICADWNHPYSTMDHQSEGVIVQQFLKIFMSGLIYRGKKPVMWSVVEKTALAEAEVEYKDHVSDAVYVAFPIVSSPQLNLENASAVIWTTTPWTLPANRAIAYHKDIIYCVISVQSMAENAEKAVTNGQKFVIARDLLESFANAVGITEWSIVEEFRGSTLEGTICRHPFANCSQESSDLAYTFEVPLLHAPHVTTEAGTGLVHTAPSHGMEDFLVGKEYNLEMPEIVKENGEYVSNLPIFGGEHIFKVADHVIQVLKDTNALLATHKVEHSYPHSWRSKSPLIFRLTQQWFLDINALRGKALDAIDKVNWFPAQSKRRIKGMVESRPDWCLSRQRVWGVPIALFLDKETNEPLRDDEVNAKIIDVISKEGIEAWHTHDADYFLKPEQQGKYQKVMDTLDVWFDSACTHHFVLENNEMLQWPADLYLEGSDQHRGWFQSSLIESIATKGVAPYKNIVTHGFTLDKDGHKMSKSLGNVISCEDIISQYGADLLRLWVISADRSDDIKIGQEILKRQEDIYRRFRNTLRYLLGALHGYNEKEALEYDAMPELEKYILYRLLELDDLRKQCMQNFDMSVFYNELHIFCSNELSAFYFDIRKDSLYCDEETSVKRRAVRTVMNELFCFVVHWLAPVLSFTAEEAWQLYPYNKHESIHEEQFPVPQAEWNRPLLKEKWEKVKQMRRVIMSAIEQERLAKTVASSLQAELVLFVTPEYASIIEDVEMIDIAIVSKFSFLIAKPQAGAVTLEEVPGVGAVVTKAMGTKCQRCWKIIERVYDGEVCERCADALDK